MLLLSILTIVFLSDGGNISKSLVFPWQPRMRKTGLRQDSLYLVRPDGYIALADPHSKPATVASYLDEHGIVLTK